MVVNFGGNKFSCRLKQSDFSNMDEGTKISFFLPHKALYIIHKFFTGEEKPPLDRYIWLEFSWELEDIVLHISGSNDKVYYKESTSSVIFSAWEQRMISKEIKKYFCKPLDKPCKV